MSGEIKISVMKPCNDLSPPIGGGRTICKCLTSRITNSSNSPRSPGRAHPQTHERVDISAWFDTHLPMIYKEISDRGLEVAGPPFARYYEFGPGQADVKIGVPLVEAPSEKQWSEEAGGHQIAMSEVPVGLGAEVVHHGPCHTLGEASGPFHDWIHAQGHDEGAGP